MNNVSLVCYHYLKRDDEFSGIRGHSSSQFRKHMDYYSKNFQFTTILELQAGLPEIEKPYLLITFDDGVKEHATVFAPLLKEYGARGVFSVPSCILRREPANPQIIRFAELYFGMSDFYDMVTAEISKLDIKQATKLLAAKPISPDELERLIKKLFKWDLPIWQARQILLNLYNKYLLPKFPDFMQRVYLHESDIVGLHHAGHTIAIHSDTHPVIGRIETNDAGLIEQEVAAPKKLFERLLGAEVDVFTYPFGQKEEVFLDPEILKDVGYKLVLTTFFDNSRNNKLDLFRLGRYQSMSQDTISDLQKNMRSYSIN